MFTFFGCNKYNSSKSNEEKLSQSKTKKETEMLPYFGKITLSDSSYYEIDDVKINSSIVSIDLNFSENKINPKALKSVTNILNNVSNIEKKIRQQLLKYTDEEGMVKEYFKIHIQEIDSQTLNDYLKDTDQNLSIELRLLSKTKLVRIGFYPDSPKSFAVFDFRVLSDFSDEILVVVLDKNGEIERITIES